MPKKKKTQEQGEVKLAGYSDHFRNLSRALQDEIIERTEQNFG